MKQTLYILLAGLILAGCSNRNIEFDDFQFTGIYFSYQTPLRTLMLGDEVLGDNTIDREHAFSIGVSMGGVYQNKKDRVVSVRYAPELMEGLQTAGGASLEILPPEYFNATFDEMVIPAGSFTGKTRIQLTDAFFQDPLTTGLHYVIPVKIVHASSGDTVLNGVPLDYITRSEEHTSELQSLM